MKFILPWLVVAVSVTNETCGRPELTPADVVRLLSRRLGPQMLVFREGRNCLQGPRSSRQAELESLQGQGYVTLEFLQFSCPAGTQVSIIIAISDKGRRETPERGWATSGGTHQLTLAWHNGVEVGRVVAPDRDTRMATFTIRTDVTPIGREAQVTEAGEPYSAEFKWLDDRWRLRTIMR